MLYIYVVKRNIRKDGGNEFDETHGFVIAAENEEQAREFASNYRDIVDDHRHRDEDRSVWLKETTIVKMIGNALKDVESGVVLEDHQWG